MAERHPNGIMAAPGPTIQADAASHSLSWMAASSAAITISPGLRRRDHLEARMDEARVAVPLTPAFSLWEREKAAAAAKASLLPRGEGQDEGIGPWAAWRKPSAGGACPWA